MTKVKMEIIPKVCPNYKSKVMDNKVKEYCDIGFGSDLKLITQTFGGHFPCKGYKYVECPLFSNWFWERKSRPEEMI